jgi:hypothetical protein
MGGGMKTVKQNIAILLRTAGRMLDGCIPKLEEVVEALMLKYGITFQKVVGAIRWKGLRLNGVFGYKRTIIKVNPSEGFE